MTNSEFDVVGIGNAIVDILAQTEDVFLENNNLAKGTVAAAEGSVWEHVVVGYSKCNAHETSWRSGLETKKATLQKALVDSALGASQKNYRKR